MSSSPASITRETLSSNTKINESLKLVDRVNSRLEEKYKTKNKKIEINSYFTLTRQIVNDLSFVVHIGSALTTCLSPLPQQLKTMRAVI